VKRREFITLVGGAALAGPLAARAQQERARRIGVLVAKAADDPEAQFRPLANIRAGLEQLGWTAGRNLQIDYREHVGTAESGRQYADELVALAPDVLVGSGHCKRRRPIAGDAHCANCLCKCGRRCCSWLC